MAKERVKFIKESWLKSNILFTGVGVCIGITIILFMSVSGGKWVSGQTMFFQILFSIIITLGVINSIYLGQKFLSLKYDPLGFFVFIYYFLSILGMIAGIELSHLILSWLYPIPYTFFHLQDVYFSTLIVLIVCTIYYTYNAQKERLHSRLNEKELDVMRLKQMKTQAELATLHSKINPHFLYNSLNSIASLIHEDPDKAESMTLKLSKLFRYSINQNQQSLVLIKDEIEISNTYLEIEKVRFGSRINFVTDVDESLMETKIPRFLVQPLIENSLKHGLNYRAEKGELFIGIRQVKEKVEIVIADNGKPFPDELHIGYGLQSTYDKLDLLYGSDYQVHISNEPQKQIKIIIPLSI